jgi:hypothetical protein
MRNFMLVVYSVGVTVCAFASVADPFIGTWEMDPARSGASSPKSEIYAVTPDGSNAVRLTKDYVGGKGVSHHATGTCKFDGKDYPVTGHSLPGATRAVKRINAHTWEVTLKSEGKIVTETREIVSDDGSTLTVTGTVRGTFATDGQTHEIMTVYRRK